MNVPQNNLTNYYTLIIVAHINMKLILKVDKASGKYPGNLLITKRKRKVRNTLVRRDEKIHN